MEPIVVPESITWPLVGPVRTEQLTAAEDTNVVQFQGLRPDLSTQDYQIKLTSSCTQQPANVCPPPVHVGASRDHCPVDKQVWIDAPVRVNPDEQV